MGEADPRLSGNVLEAEHFFSHKSISAWESDDLMREKLARLQQAWHPYRAQLKAAGLGSEEIMRHLVQGLSAIGTHPQLGGEHG